MPPSSSQEKGSSHSTDGENLASLLIKGPSSPSINAGNAAVDGAMVHVSDSPAKSDPNVWLKDFDLCMSDKKILESPDQWLKAAQVILSKQCGGKIVGLQHTQCTKSGFKPLIPNSKFIQILHISGCHWIVASNITPSDQSCSLSSVGIYDSIKIMSVSDHLKKQICSFAHPMSGTYYIFDIIEIQSQPNSSDCGLFAIACATELIEGFDPATCHWSCR